MSRALAPAPKKYGEKLVVGRKDAHAAKPNALGAGRAVSDSVEVDYPTLASYNAAVAAIEKLNREHWVGTCKVLEKLRTLQPVNAQRSVSDKLHYRAQRLEDIQPGLFKIDDEEGVEFLNEDFMQDLDEYTTTKDEPPGRMQGPEHPANFTDHGQTTEKPPTATASYTPNEQSAATQTAPPGPGMVLCPQCKGCGYIDNTTPSFKLSTFPTKKAVQPNKEVLKKENYHPNKQAPSGMKPPGQNPQQKHRKRKARKNNRNMQQFCDHHSAMKSGAVMSTDQTTRESSGALPKPAVDNLSDDISLEQSSVKVTQTDISESKVDQEPEQKLASSEEDFVQTSGPSTPNASTNTAKTVTAPESPRSASIGKDRKTDEDDGTTPAHSDVDQGLEGVSISGEPQPNSSSSPSFQGQQEDPESAQGTAPVNLSEGSDSIEPKEPSKNDSMEVASGSSDQQPESSASGEKAKKKKKKAKKKNKTTVTPDETGQEGSSSKTIGSVGEEDDKDNRDPKKKKLEKALTWVNVRYKSIKETGKWDSGEMIRNNPGFCEKLYNLDDDMRETKMQHFKGRFDAHKALATSGSTIREPIIQDEDPKNLTEDETLELCDWIMDQVILEKLEQIHEEIANAREMLSERYLSRTENACWYEWQALEDSLRFKIIWQTEPERDEMLTAAEDAFERFQSEPIWLVKNSDPHTLSGPEVLSLKKLLANVATIKLIWQVDRIDYFKDCTALEKAKAVLESREYWMGNDYWHPSDILTWDEQASLHSDDREAMKRDAEEQLSRMGKLKKESEPGGSVGNAKDEDIIQKYNQLWSQQILALCGYLDNSLDGPSEAATAVGSESQQVKSCEPNAGDEPPRAINPVDPAVIADKIRIYRNYTAKNIWEDLKHEVMLEQDYIDKAMNMNTDETTVEINTVFADIKYWREKGGDDIFATEEEWNDEVKIRNKYYYLEASARLKVLSRIVGARAKKLNETVKMVKKGKTTEDLEEIEEELEVTKNNKGKERMY